jgi:hypothetical protein
MQAHNTIEYRGNPPKKHQITLGAVFFGAGALGFLGGLGTIIIVVLAGTPA